MFVEIEITDREIDQAEEILLLPDNHFNTEARDFIKCLDTLDLQAVPGSGKTTALLAKLIILERHLPFTDGSGILVISHTNAAIDEIKKRIGKHCPKIFVYPNFIGTIQSFVDTFLAMPAYIGLYKKRPLAIDNDKYSQKMNEFSKYNLTGFTQDEAKRVKHFLNANKCCTTFRFSFDGTHSTLVGGVRKKPLLIKKPNQAWNYIDWTEPEKERIKEWLTKFKWKITKLGFLCFDDAYFLAEYYISQFPKIISLIRRRFPMVFIDEMQDMGKHQYDLLEQIFFEKDIIFQRIGDKNQAIYNGRNIAIEEVWEDREKVITLNDSPRLSALNAKVLTAFALYRKHDFHINGKHPSNINPHLIIYDDNSVPNVVQRFVEILKLLYEQGKISPSAPKVFKVVAWNSTWEKPPEGINYRLSDFCPNFQRKSRLKTDELETLADFLFQLDSTDQTFSNTRKCIFEGILKVLEIANISNPENNQHFTRESFLAFFRKTYSPVKYDGLNLRIFQCASAILDGQIELALEKITPFILYLLDQFDKSDPNLGEFINGPLSKPIGKVFTDPNILNFGEIEVEVGTVHSVKGQTHTATLYLESYYHNDFNRSTGSGKSYESQRLADQFKGVPLKSLNKKHVTESAKMVYVGFSRPTHLLCFAVHKTRYSEFLGDIDKSIWEVSELFEK